MLKYHLWPEKPLRNNDITELAATLEKSNQERQRIWFRLPSDHLPAITGTMDSFVLAALFSAMSAAADLEIHGEVSPSLLSNLVEFQKAWSLWLPLKYHPVDFSADTEREQPRVETDEVILGFSGGVDSAFSAWQHRPIPKALRQQNLAAGILVHGFDIPIDQQDVFASAEEKARKMLASIGVNLITVSTNLRDQHNDWEDSHAAALAACLVLFQGKFKAGLIASSYPYNSLIIPWGSNPLTDPLLSTGSFRIIHDGSTSTRIEKMKQIGQWQEARQYLRVCWEGRQKDRNCCRCQKCVTTMLIFNALGFKSLPAFPYEISDREIRHLKYSDPSSLHSTSRVIKMLKGLDFPSASTLRALKVSVVVNRLRLASWKYPWSKKVFKLFEKRWFLDPNLVG